MGALASLFFVPNPGVESGFNTPSRGTSWNDVGLDEALKWHLSLDLVGYGTVFTEAGILGLSQPDWGLQLSSLTECCTRPCPMAAVADEGPQERRMYSPSP